jgi:hypothetical protein
MGRIGEEIPEIPQVEPLFTLWGNFQKSITSETHENVTAPEARNALQIAIDILEHIKPIEI